MLSSYLALVAFIAQASAHGTVLGLVSGGTLYPAWGGSDPYVSPEPKRIGRKTGGNGPMLDVDALSIQCNENAWSTPPTISANEPAALVAPVKAGEDITLNWSANWPHPGSVLTYLADCQGDCATFKAGTDKVWFKIDAAGYDVATKTWATDKITKDEAWTLTLPSTIPNGQYLLRHEIIGLHVAGMPWNGNPDGSEGAQFYSSCLQIDVSGGGNKAPTSNELVSFPGGYKADEPGIVWDVNSGKEYPIPGPPMYGSGSAADPPAPIIETSSKPSSSPPSASVVPQEDAPLPSSQVQVSSSAAPAVSATQRTSVSSVRSSTLVEPTVRPSSSMIIAPSQASTSVASKTSSISAPAITKYADYTACMRAMNDCRDLVNRGAGKSFADCDAIEASCSNASRFKMHKKRMH